MLGWLKKIRTWLNPDGDPRGKKPAADSASDQENTRRLRYYLGGQAPGLWVSDHLAETQMNVGWSFIAVRAIAKQAMQAHLACFRHPRPGSPDAGKPGGVLARPWDRDFGTGEGKSSFRRAARRRAAKGATVSTEGHKPDRRPLPEHDPLVDLLRQPNPDQDGGTFLFQGVQQLCLTGSMLVWLVPNGFGKVTEMYVIPTGLATPLPPTQEFPRGRYRVAPLASYSTGGPWEQDGYQPPGALDNLLSVGGILDARQVKAIRWPHPLFLSDGLSSLSACSMFIDVAEQLDRAIWYSLKNSSMPGLVFAVKDAEANPSREEKEAFREDVRARNSGTLNAGKDLFLPPGVEAEQLERSPVEMDYVQSRPQVRDNVLATQQVPPIAAGISEAGSYATYHASMKQFTELSVQPILELVGKGLTSALRKHFGRDKEVTYKARATDDPTILNERLKIDISSTAFKVDEYRAARGLPPLGGEEGERLIGKPPEPAPGMPGQPGANGRPDPKQDPLGALAKPFTLADDAPTDTDTGIRQPHRDMVPGRNGKGLGGFAGRFRKDYDPDEARDEGGKWTSGGGGGSRNGTATAERPKAKQGKGIKLRPVKERAFTGEQVPLKNPLSKQEAGALGEEIVIAYLKAQGMADARHLNLGQNNYPIDLIQDHECVEVKTGQVGNSPGAQQWRLTIGEPGKEEKAWLAQASPEEKAAWNRKKMKGIHDRKEKARRLEEKRLGRKVKAATMTVLINPDTGVADVFRFEGWHDRIGWNSDMMKQAYVGSFNYA